MVFFCSINIGDNNTSNKANSSSTDHANTSSDDSNAPANVGAGNTITNTSDGGVKFVEAPLPKVNAWKVS